MSDGSDLTLDLFAEPEADEPETLTVSELNRAVKDVLQGAFPPLWVSGEVANWKRAGSGHCYFTLKDEAAQLRCVMWRHDAARLPMDPEDGMEVRVHGAVGLYEARGEYQMNVRRLEAVGEEGLFRQAFEKLKAQLDAEGLLDPARKRPVPRMPITVGVVTSTTGAALRDILSVIGRRAPWTRVVVMGSRVQGTGAGQEVARAVRTLGASARVDTLIVGRGGGSIEDLWAFNEEPVARAVAACPVPVISAVGHETDVTISDLVADLRAPTPSAAAEAAVPDGGAMAEWLAAAPPRLETALQTMVRRRREAVTQGIPRLRRAVEVLVEPRRRRVEGVAERLARAMGDVVERRRRGADVLPRLARAMQVLVSGRRRDLGGLAGRLDALSPLATLERGYAVPLTDGGRVLRGVDDFAPGRTFQLRVVDGRVACHADEILERDERRSRDE